jgi:hypothetical protein
MTSRLGVSIIIPNYNYERYLGEAIDSALAQTHPLVEVIVVDDGSTDGSRGVIERYGDRVTAIFQANAGQTRACAAGFARSRHPIVFILDSDDRLVPEAAAIAAADWPDGCSKKQFRLRTLPASGTPLDHCWPKYSRDLPPELIRSELLRTGYYQCPPTSGNAFARRFLEQVSPFDAHPHVDAVLNTLAPLYGDVVTSQAVIGYYRLHGSNNFSTDRVEAARFASQLAADDARIAIMAAHCRKLGMPFDGEQALRRLLPYRELELVIAKLEANGPGDQLGVLRLLVQTIGAGLAHPQAAWHGLLRGLWILAVALAPRPLAVGLIGMRYLPTARPPVIEAVVNAWRRQRVAG